MEYASVHLLENPYHIDTDYDYYIPPDLRTSVRVGGFVMVPFGASNRKRLGVVTATSDAPKLAGVSCKPIVSAVHEDLTLTEEQLGLCHFMKEQTLCSVGDAVHAMLPASVLSRLVEVYRASPAQDEPKEALDDGAALLICEYIRKNGSVRFDLLKSKFGPAAEPALRHLRKKGYVYRDFEVRATEEKTKRVYTLALSEEALDAVLDGSDRHYRLRAECYPRVLSLLRDADGRQMEEEALLTLSGASTANLKTLCEKGILSRSEVAVDRASLGAYITEPRPIVLNEEQEAAYNTLSALLDSGEPHGALLHGVTGSGKTCVMLRLIDRALAMGRGVIVLLPEIALTPQTLGIFCSHYGERVAVIHSALSAGERFDTDQKIRRGRADVVIGTRSAIFAPLQNPGLIIIDEEQEHTYKSDMSPKYHARDIARFRCAHHGALMLLCSATPSLESFRKAEEGSYTLVTLRGRYGSAKLPRVTVTDMRRETAAGNLSPLSNLLCERLVETFERGEQSVLFLNRRGYNNFLSCRTCGEPLRCPDCSVSMTYHTTDRSFLTGELRCHWCGKRLPLPETCPSCGGSHLIHMGYGTQRVEQELSSLLPKARILRMDTDTTSSRDSYETMLGAFRRHEADILLGTQMVTKGHDFPDVTLVGVLSADSSLFLDDYRAEERTFAMLTQVIGRAGRAEKPGEAIIQTSNPDHECIRYACEQDYEGFYAHEKALRRSLTFPPFCDLAMFTLTGREEKEVLRGATLLAQMLQKANNEDYPDVPLICYGPFEAPVYKVENRYRMRLVVKCRLVRRSRALFAKVYCSFSRSAPKGLSLSVDFNPSSI